MVTKGGSGGYKYLRGYPIKKQGASGNDESEDNSSEDDFIIFVELQCVGSWFDVAVANGALTAAQKRKMVEVTGLPGRTVRVIRKPRKHVEAEFTQRRQLAALLESTRLLVRPKKKKDVKEENVEESETKFKVRFCHFFAYIHA